MAKLYYSTYICQLWLGDSKKMSDKAIKGLNPALISIAKNISSTSSRSSLWLIWNYKRNLKFQLWFHPLWGPQQPGALGGGLPEGVWRDILELLAKAGSQGLAWAPCPDQPHSGPLHQSSQWKTFPHWKRKTVHRREPQAAEGHRVGRIIIETLSFACNFKSIAMSFMMKCLRHFWLDILKKTVSP